MSNSLLKKGAKSIPYVAIGDTYAYTSTIPVKKTAIKRGTIAVLAQSIKKGYLVREKDGKLFAASKWMKADKVKWMTSTNRSLNLSKYIGAKATPNFTYSELVGGFKNNPMRYCRRTIQLVQVCREYFGKGIYINSTYRNVTQNKAVGGIPNSRHLYPIPGTGGAIDFSTTKDAKLYSYANAYLLSRIKKVFNIPKMYIEVGYASFTHIDTGDNGRGIQNAGGKLINGYSDADFYNALCKLSADGKKIANMVKAITKTQLTALLNLSNYEMVKNRKKTFGK